MSDLTGLLDELEGELDDVLAPESAAINDIANKEGHASEHRFFGPYELIELVGQGGVAEVYRATHVNPAYAGQVFAVKLLHEDVSRNAQIVEFFRAEAYLLSLLRHPNIVRTFEASAIDSTLYLAMEYIEGRNLEELNVQLIRAGLSMPRSIILYIVSEVSRALQFAHNLTDSEGHRLGVVHRDVNPANIFLDFNGRVLLGDFGVAVINNASVSSAQKEQVAMAGKAGYFAPEQFEGQSDYRADIYALGIVLYERLAGHLLFEGESTEQILKANRRGKIPLLPPDKASPEINAILQKILARSPKDRYQSAGRVQKALEPLLPPPPVMRLAVAVLMRSLFVSEYSHELLLKEQHYGNELSPSKNPVLVISHDERTRLAFRDLLISKGYPTATIAGIDSLQTVLEAATVPEVILVDIHSPTFSPLLFRSKLSAYKHTPAIVALSNDFSLTSIEAAHALGAIDLLFKPYSIERVICSIIEAAMKAHPLQNNTISAPINNENSFATSVAIISQNDELVEHFKNSLKHAGYNLEYLKNSAALVEAIHHKSFKAVIYDAMSPLLAQEAPTLPAMFHDLPGFESLPLIYLAEGKEAIDLANLKTLKRTAVTCSDVRPVHLARVIERLLSGEKYGRCFTRYAQKCAVSLRHGGQIFEGVTENISRGGLLVRCGAVPALEATIGITLKLPIFSEPIEVRGKVVRVTPASAAFDGKPGTGVSFLSFAGDSEELLVSYIIYMEEKNVPKV